MMNTAHHYDAPRRGERQAPGNGKRRFEDPLLTAREVAELLGCHPQHVYRLACRRQLPCYKPEHIGLRFRESDILKHVYRGRQPVTRDPKPIVAE